MKNIFLGTAFPNLQKLLSKVQFEGRYRTPQRLYAYDPDPNAPIYNVSDAFFKLTQYLVENQDNVMNKNTADYQHSKSLGTLKVSPELQRQMEFRFATVDKTKGEEGRLVNPEISNVVL
jgi:hypothetical protein